MSPAGIDLALVYYFRYLVANGAVFHPPFTTDRTTIDYEYNNNVQDPIYLKAEGLVQAGCPTLDFLHDADNATLVGQRAFKALRNGCTCLPHQLKETDVTQ